MSDALVIGIVSAVCGAIPPTILAWAALKAAQKATVKTEEGNAKIDELHKEVNSRLSQLVEKTAGESHAQGELKGRADARAEAEAGLKR